MFKKKTQKIIIPKGTIDPNEDTLIEIPIDLKGKPVIVAQKLADKEKTVGVEKTNKNVDFGEDQHCELDDHRTTNVVKEGDSSFSPQHRSSFKNDVEFDDLFKTRPVENDHRQSSYEKMQTAKRELNKTFFVTTSQDHLSMSCSGSLVNDPNETTDISKQTASTSICCSDKSLQCKPSNLQNDLASSNSRKIDEPITNILYWSRSTLENPPKFGCLKRNDRDNSATDVQQQSSKISQYFDKQEDDARFNFKMDKSTSSDHSGRNYSESSRRFTKNVPLEYSDEFTGRSANMQPTNMSKECCKKRVKPVLRNQSSTSDDDEFVNDREKLKQFYKCSGSNLDDVYIDQMRRQFEEAKRKLEDAIMLASTSLKRFQTNKHLSTELAKSISGLFDSSEASICDCFPEKDVPFIPAGENKSSCATDSSKRAPSALSSNEWIKPSPVTVNGSLRSAPDNTPANFKPYIQKVPSTTESTSRCLVGSKNKNLQSEQKPLLIPACGSKSSCATDLSKRAPSALSSKEWTKPSLVTASGSLKTLENPQPYIQKVPSSTKSTSRCLMGSMDKTLQSKQRPVPQTDITTEPKNYSMSSVSSKCSHSCSKKKSTSIVKIVKETRCCGTQTFTGKSSSTVK